ncbi:MAG: type II toxin-antitoxin system mRNA interferase toxin, RelE/StbE family [Candidatus Roizmanbacteria bacterium]|nr:type II toxin-antitoxin system mRNA interferase toxin, RelE/StbE family [Candidatus Roizmanbacteria bacterium]
MKIIFHKIFVKHFDKRIKINSNLLERFKVRYRLFINERNNNILRDHSLSGILKGKRSFSITGDIRIIYQENDGIIEFLDIGSHNQIYR